MKKILRFLFDLTRQGTYNRISFYQIVSQNIAALISFILIIFGAIVFCKSIFDYCFANSDSALKFYSLLKGLLSSLELFFMAPIPFLIVFSHRRNINQAFADLRPVQRSGIDLDEIKAKKGFISSLIGILSTFILSMFFEILSNNPESIEIISNEHFWRIFSIICMLFLFLTVLIIYYKLLYDKES